MFLNYHHHLSMIEFEVGYVYQVIDENYNLDIWKQTTWTSEPMKKLVSRKLLIFKGYHVDFNKIECFFPIMREAWNHIPTIEFLTHQILTIMGSKIETQRIFVLVNILTNLRRCHLQLNNLKKSWIKIHHNDPKVCCKDFLII